MKTSNIWIITLWVMIFSLLINVGLYFAGTSAGIMRTDLIMPEGGDQITLFPVVMSTIIGTIGGILVFKLISRFSSNPFSTFRIVALVVLILSFGLPATIDMPLSMMVLLNIMHVTVAVFLLYFLNLYRKAKTVAN